MQSIVNQLIIFLITGLAVAQYNVETTECYEAAPSAYEVKVSQFKSNNKIKSTKKPSTKLSDKSQKIREIKSENLKTKAPKPETKALPEDNKSSPNRLIGRSIPEAKEVPTLLENSAKKYDNDTNVDGYQFNRTSNYESTDQTSSYESNEYEKAKVPLSPPVVLNPLIPDKKAAPSVNKSNKVKEIVKSDDFLKPKNEKSATGPIMTPNPSVESKPNVTSKSKPVAAPRIDLPKSPVVAPEVKPKLEAPSKPPVATPEVKPKVDAPISPPVAKPETKPRVDTPILPPTATPESKPKVDASIPPPAATPQTKPKVDAPIPPPAATPESKPKVDVPNPPLVATPETKIKGDAPISPPIATPEVKPKIDAPGPPFVGTPKVEIPNPAPAPESKPKIETPPVATPGLNPKVETPPVATQVSKPKVETPPVATQESKPKVETPPVATPESKPKIDAPSIPSVVTSKVETPNPIPESKPKSDNPPVFITKAENSPPKDSLATKTETNNKTENKSKVDSPVNKPPKGTKVGDFSHVNPKKNSPVIENRKFDTPINIKPNAPPAIKTPAKPEEIVKLFNTKQADVQSKDKTNPPTVTISNTKPEVKPTVKVKEESYPDPGKTTDKSYYPSLESNYDD